MGFISKMQGWFNICKLVSMVHHIKRVNYNNHDAYNRCRNQTTYIYQAYHVMEVLRRNEKYKEIEKTSEKIMA